MKTFLSYLGKAVYILILSVLFAVVVVACAVLTMSVLDMIG